MNNIEVMNLELLLDEHDLEELFELLNLDKQTVLEELYIRGAWDFPFEVNYGEPDESD